ncbi:MAG: DUF4136 domain-containing protein, partial [Gammaproteobacteria bacterium]|nr:DUF4136 domain-containing protein [Gammaproteobacteria bacterium]
LAAALGVAVALGACAGDMIFAPASRDGSAAFAEYLDYRWLPPDDARQAAWRERHARLAAIIEAAVDRELAAKGYRRREAGAVDFLIGVHADLEEVAIVSSARYRGRGHGYEHFRVPSMRNVSHIDREPQAMLGARIVDAASERVVWMARAAGIVGDGEGRERRLEELVAGLLAEFPPPR